MSNKKYDYEAHVSVLLRLLEAEFGPLQPDVSGTWYSEKAHVWISIDRNEATLKFEEKPRSLDYLQAFHREFLLGLRIVPTKENIELHSVPDEDLQLLYECDECWVILNNTDGVHCIDVVWKSEDGTSLSKDKRMKGIEL